MPDELLQNGGSRPVPDPTELTTALVAQAQAQQQQSQRFFFAVVGLVVTVMLLGLAIYGATH